MKVSVITVCWNSGGTIAAAMESVLAQRGVEVEYIVVDGGSKDGTVERIKEYAEKFGGRMRWTSERDEGMYDAINKGIMMASGDIVGILNADDMLEGPDTLRRIAEAFGDERRMSCGSCDELSSARALTRLSRVDKEAGSACPASTESLVADSDSHTPANSCSLTHPTSSLQAPASKDCARPEEGLYAAQDVNNAAGQTPDGGIQAGAGDGESPRVEAVYADVRFVKADLATTVRYYSAKHWKPWMLQWGKMPPHPSVYIRREWFAKLGGYKLGYDIAADYELLIRYLRKAGLKTRYIPGSVVRMRMGGKSTRGWRSNWRLNQEIVRGNRENGYRCCMAMLAPKYAFKIFEFILPRLGFNRKGA